MGKTHEKKRKIRDPCSIPSATTVVDCISVNDCTENKEKKGKHKSKTRTDRMQKDDDQMNTDTQFNELTENILAPVVLVNGKEPSDITKKSKKSSAKEASTQSMAAKNVTVEKPNVGKSKKRKHIHPSLDEENARPSDKLKNSGKKVKEMKHQAVVSDIASSGAVTSSKKSKKSSESAKKTNNLTNSINKTEKTLKAASSRKGKKQRVDSEIQTDENAGSEKTVPVDSTAKYHALEYLRRWKLQRSEWSFQKVRQVWLLQNMYDEKKV